MGSRTDIAERNVSEQRRRLSRMVSDLEHRTSEDVHAAGNRIGERASEIQARAGNAMDSVPGKHVIDEQVPKHPLSSLVGGFGAGMVIGMLSYRGSDGHGGGGSQRQPDRSNQQRDQSSDGGGLFDALSAAAMTSIAAPLQQELKGIARQAVDGFLGKDSRESTPKTSVDPTTAPAQMRADGNRPREELKDTKPTP